MTKSEECKTGAEAIYLLLKSLNLKKICENKK